MINDSSNIISFDNTEYAFAHMNDGELKKAKFLFGLMGNAFWLNLGLKLMPLAIKYKFPFTKTILRKGIEIKGEYETGEQYTELIKLSKMRHHYLVNGIPTFIRTHFSKFTLKSINSYLVTPTMSNDIIQKLIDNFTRAMTKINRNKTGQHKNKHEKLTSLFVSHILTKPAQKSEEEFFKFIEKLLKFWSASSFYKQNEEYKIQINNGLTVQHLPQSHTCFFLIDLPDYTTVGTDDEIGKRLYDKIDNAISNAAGGFLLAGGNRQIIN